MSSPFPELTREEREQSFCPDNPQDYLEKEAVQLGFGMHVEEPHIQDMQRLASGGTGTIFCGRDGVLGRMVALKTLSPLLQYVPGQMKRLVSEARAAAQLEHPNIIPIHSLGISPTRGVYFTMKRLRGDSLRHIISQLALRNPGYVREYTLSVRLGIFLKICQGIRYAHSHGVIHRDLKPENVLVGNYGEVTIIDWGLVKKVRNGADAAVRKMTGGVNDDGYGGQASSDRLDGKVQISTENLTDPGELNGTPRFMSPEQVGGNSEEIDSRTDIYALGIILYELLTFTNPFSQIENENDIMMAVSRGQYKRPRETYGGKAVSPELEAICLKAMRMEKENRYQSVREIIDDITAHMDGRAVSAYAAPMAVRTVKCIRRNPIKATVLFTSILAIVAYVCILQVVNAFAVKRTLELAENDCSIVTRKLSSLEAQIRREVAAGGAATAEQLERQRMDLDEIDNLMVGVYLLLGAIPQQRRYVDRINRMREQLIHTRIRFALKYGKTDDMRKVRGMAITQFGYGMERLSGSMQYVMGLLNNALAGAATLTIESEAMEFSLYSVSDDKKVQDNVLGEPLELSARTLPLVGLELNAGNYMLVVHAKDGHEVRLGFSLSPAERASIRLDLPSEVPDGMVFVPACKQSVFTRPGTGRQGQDGDGTLPMKQAAFFISRHEVTLGEYAIFWKQLDSKELKERYRAHIRLEEKDQKTVLPWDDNGTIRTVTTDGRRMFHPDMPVTGITHEAAEAYCQWLGKRIGRVCRLPSVREWCRAAVGDLPWKYPWGVSIDKEAAFILDNMAASAAYPLFAPVGSFPRDKSPYGVLDMAGNAREWTSSRFADDGQYQVMGASASTPSRYLDLAAPSALSSFPSDIGFRVVMDTEPPKP